MRFTEEAWKADYKAIALDAAKDGRGPSDGLVCILASINHIRKGLIKDGISRAQIDKSFSELLIDLNSEEISNHGFCCNASAAMKACGLSSAAAISKALVLPDLIEEVKPQPKK